MRLRLAADQIQALTAALARAGRREIGGQLFGELLAPSDLRVTELTIQARPGTFARFVVDLVQAARDAIKFFDRTKHRYARFNYIGEWHSHPRFEVRPSITDIDTMRCLVVDPTFRGQFAVLMIARLDDGRPAIGAWLFDPHGREAAVQLKLEP